jgi:hypothetical protein
VPPRWAVATCSNVWDRDIVQRHASWEGLCAALTRFRVIDVSDKRMLPAWIPALWKPGTRREAGRNHLHIEHLSCVVFDFDSGISIDDASARWADWPHIVHTSFSHTPDAPRFRLVLPLARPCPVGLWPRAWAELAKRAGEGIDPVCKDPGRLYFQPAIRWENRPHEARVVDEGSSLLDLELERLVEEERREAEARAAQQRLPTKPTRSHYPEGRGADREIQERLKNDSTARARVAELLGARVDNGRAHGIRCPRCARPDVWFLVEPQAGKRQAECNHRNSCGWRGWLDELCNHLDGARP